MVDRWFVKNKKLNEIHDQPTQVKSIEKIRYVVRLDKRLRSIVFFPKSS